METKEKKSFKVIRRKDGFFGFEEMEFYCGKCEREIETRFKFCPFCGELIDWSK